MKSWASTPTLAIALVTSIFVAACDAGGPGTLTPTATVSGVVRAAIEGASVSVGAATSTTGADGRFELQDLPVGPATVTASAPHFGGPRASP